MKHSVSSFIGLGSNLNEPILQLSTAINTLKNTHDIDVIAVSRFYRTAPMGPKDQPDYVNSVIEISTTLNPNDLLTQLQIIENQQGRVRNTEHWGARTLDLDILTYGAEIIQETHLTVPHVGIRERSFVLYPLRDLTDQLNIANLGSIQSMIDTLGEPCPDIISAA